MYYLLAKIGFDTVENESSKVWCNAIVRFLTSTGFLFFCPASAARFYDTVKKMRQDVEAKAKVDADEARDAFAEGLELCFF